MLETLGLRQQSTTTALWLSERAAGLRRIAATTTCRLMGGHWHVLSSERERLSLRCVACGHSTPGWEVGRRRS